ncbi:YjfA family protein [Streptomyces sp. LP05-1]|uniref:YjfA family protein n=1 Tax=Streptomyces pyxinae TaxID=2970734 RepID=A0ABT2CIF7_9ACTN|nr:YjfA family protein [Streptomyces sp. LP05-1]
MAWPTATPGPDLAVWSALTKSGAPQSGAPQPGAAKSGAAAGEARPAGSAISKGAGNPSAAPAPTSAAPADGAPAQPGAASAGSAPTGTPAPAADKAAATPPATATTAGSASAPAAPRATGWRAVLPTVLSGALGALLVIVATVLLTGSWGGFGFGGDDRGQGAAPSAPAPGRSAASLPPGVRCSGAGCTGKDPEAMGCGGAHATTVAARAVGAGAVEIRYSKVCGAAWARLTRADAGDRVTLTVNGTTREGEAAGTSDAYTPMVAVPGKARPTACAVRPDGSRNCATPLTGG